MLGNRHGGIGRYSLELAKNILRTDKINYYKLFVNPKNSDEGDIKQFEQFSNATIIPANIRHYSLMEQIKFWRVLNKENLDLVHFMNFNVPIMYDRPFIVTIHDVVHHKIGGAKKSRLPHFLAYKKVIGNASKKAARVITVSEYSKNDISKYLQIPLEKIDVVYEGASVKTDISESRISQVKKKYLLDKPYLLFVGVLERKKNVINLARGFDVLLKKYKFDIDLVFAGKPDPHYPEIKYKAMDIKFKDHLVFTDYLEDEDLAALYKGAHAFVSASMHEGFGLPGVEAMKFGLPLVVSNIDVFNEIYDKAAIYFNPLDPDDIAEKISLLVSDEKFHAQMQTFSFTQGQKFNWEETAKQTLNIYQKALNEI